MTLKEKIIFLALIPLCAAGMGAGATYLAANQTTDQVVVAGEAVKAAKDGKLTIEIVRKNEENSDSMWPLAFLMVGGIFGFAAYAWALTRD